MAISAALVLEVNDAFARIPITPERARELETELAQFARAIETARQHLVFASEPGDFLTALERLAEVRHV